MRSTTLWILATALAALLALPHQQDAEGIADIASPQNNEIVSGAVTITGTAVDIDFRFYQLDYNIDPTPSDVPWTAVQPPVAQQVRDGILGIWDTTGLPDGRYVLRLQVIRNDGQAISDEVHVQIGNATPTPLPTLPPPPTPTPPPGTPTPGPSPTPLIWQPPTRTPRPSPTPGGPTVTPTPMDLSDSPLRADRLRLAAWRGMLITVSAFAVLGVYSLIRAAARGTLRTAWWRFRREIVNPVLDTLRGTGKGARRR